MKFLGKWMTLKQRRNLADGLIMSQIIYRIQVWGNMVQKITIERIQTVQTLAMRWITGGSIYKNSPDYMSREDILKETDWLSF